MSFVAYSSTTVSDISSNLILSVDTWYYLSTSNKTLIGGKWETIPPAWEENKYYWQKTITTYNNGTTTETKPICITGGTGQPGTGIEQISEEYAISDSKTIAPKTGWQGIAPKWEYGKYIWSRTKIVYKNPTSIVYTTPICDSAWEVVNGIEVGGRNLILNSSFKNCKSNGIYTFNGDEVTFSTNTPLNNNNSSAENFRISFLMSNYFLKNIRGKTITISMDYYIEKSIVYGTTNPFIGIEIGLKRNNDTGGSNQYLSWYGGKTFPTNVTGKWIRYSKSVTVSDHDVASYGVYLYMMDASGTVKFRHPKIEFGNMATGWSPAPEDTEEELNTITTTLSGVHSVVDKLDKTITDKVWQDDITTKINQYDGTVTESIRSRVTETEKNINGITSTVKDMETTVSKKADDSTVETLNTRLTKAEQDASGFKTTVQDYFTTTDKTLNGIQSWRTEVNQKISKDGILSTVGDYYATQDDLNNLNIGGSNLVSKENVQKLNDTSVTVNGYTFDISGKVTSNNFDGVFIPETIFQKDEFYVFSYKFSVKSGSITYIGGHQAAFRTIKAIVDDVEYKTEYDSGFPLDNKKTEHTVVVYLKYLGIGNDKKLYIQPNRARGVNTSWNILLSEIQVEKGNMKTAWSPSYQDTLNDIDVGTNNLIRNSSFEKQGKGWYLSYPQGSQFVKEGKDGNYCVKITGKYNQYSTVQTEQTFTSRPGETYTLSALTKSKDIVKGTTNYFVSLYVAFYDKNNKWVAEEEIQNGNMPLSTDWIKNVMTFTVPNISTIDYMKIAGFSRDFAGTLWWDNFKLETGNKATDWTPAQEDIYDDIDSIKIGSRNFLRNGNFAKTTTMGASSKHPNLYPLGWGGFNSGINNPATSWHAHIDNTTFGFNVVEFNESDGNRNWKGICARKQTDFLFVEKLEEEYRFSVDVYATGAGTKLFGGFYYFKKGGTEQQFHSGYYEIHPEIINKWTRMSVAVPLKDDIDFSKDFYFYIYGYNFKTNAILYIKDAALTTGNKTADWSPAPEETEKYIANVETIANQTKDKFAWLVKSGTSATNFELTDRTATLVANYINLKGLVTFAGLNSDIQGKISSAYNWTSGNGANMSKLNDMVKAWTGGAVSATTTINGGFIRTNTITAAQIATGAIITEKLAAGSVTTDKLTTNNIVGTNGWINLRSGTFNYGNGKFVWNGSTLTVNGSGSFSGTITSSAGTIGGWSITGSCIYRGTGYNAVNSMYFGTAGLSVSNKFKVDANGNVTMAGATMTEANVSGTITSSAGTIGGWSITGSCIYRGSADYNTTNGMYFGTSGLRLGASFKVNNTGYATINGGTFTGTINAETGKISGWRLLSSRLVSLDVDVQNETDFTNKGTKAVYLAKYNYNGQGSISAIGVQTRTSTSNSWVNRIDIRYDGSMVFKNQNDVIVTKFENGNWSDIGTISCNDVVIKQNAKSYKLSHRMLVCDDTANVLGVGMTTSGDRFIPMKDKKADYAHGKIAIGSNQNRFSEIWSVKALNTTSDRNLKTNMSPFDIRYENFFMDLNTCTFMYKNFTYDDTHDRLHWGIDAQQAEQALEKNNITLGEAGFLCIDNLEYPNAAGQMKEYSVRYSELIGLNIHMTQKSHMRIKELEKQNQKLEKRIAILEERLK